MAYRQYRRNYSGRGRARRGRRSSSPVRTTHWYRNPVATMAGLASGAVAIDLLPDDVLDPGARLGATVTRIRLSLVASWVIAQVTPPWHFWTGIYVGPPTFPTLPLGPGAHANDVDWMHWAPVPATSESMMQVQTGTDPNIVTLNQCYYEWDIKSQRRFWEPTDKLWLIGQTENNQGVQASFDPVFTSSVLIKR